MLLDIKLASVTCYLTRNSGAQRIEPKRKEYRAVSGQFMVLSAIGVPKSTAAVTSDLLTASFPTILRQNIGAAQ